MFIENILCIIYFFCLNITECYVADFEYLTSSKRFSFLRLRFYYFRKMFSLLKINFDMLPALLQLFLPFGKNFLHILSTILVGCIHLIKCWWSWRVLKSLGSSYCDEWEVTILFRPLCNYGRIDSRSSCLLHIMVRRLIWIDGK